MIKKFKNSKAFTLIELIVVVGVIGILVLIASSNFSKQTEKAKHNAALADMRIVADATDMYNIDNNDWPRLSDVHYTADELKAYSESFYDATGKKANLDTKGKYYDIDYDKLSQYAKAPVNKENYILQNPAGKVFYMENLTVEGKERVDYGQPSQPIIPEEPALYEFTSHTFTNAGQSGRFGPSQSRLDNAYKDSQVDGHVTSDNGIQLWTVPKTGTYRIEAYGAQGGGERGGQGAIMKGTFNLIAKDKYKVVVGQKGDALSGSRDGSRPGGGGGGSFIYTGEIGGSGLLISSGGGGGQGNLSSGGNIRPGLNATTEINGVDSHATKSTLRGRGGIDGQGGSTSREGTSNGGGGAGWKSDGENGTRSSNSNLIAEGGKRFTGGEKGISGNSSNGGFGGGGAGSAYNNWGVGGGGGYSGGGAGGNPGSSINEPAGGGGSFNSGANQDNSVGNTGHGKVVITYIK